jgi:hypothetical protein
VFVVDGADGVVEFIIVGFESDGKIEVVFKVRRFVVFCFIVEG